MDHWGTSAALGLGPHSMFSAELGGEVTTSGRHTEPEADMIHALDSKFKGVHRQYVVHCAGMT